MKIVLRAFFILCPILVGCAPSSHTTRDVSELMPAEVVQAERNGRTMTVSWQPSPHANRDDFAGYHVYVARRSLVMAPVARLPAPIFVPGSQHSVTVDTLDPKARYFVHVRSQLQSGEQSLPSLPEKIVEPEGSKNP